MRWTLALAALSLVASGCLRYDDRPLCVAPVGTTATLPELPALFDSFAAGSGINEASFADGWWTVALANLTPGQELVQDVRSGLWESSQVTVLQAANATAPGFYVVGDAELGGQPGDAQVLLQARPTGDDSCRPAELASIGLAKADGPRQVASAGRGVHVMTAGFWDNGTLFYTNIAELDNADWPRAGWYAWEGGDPLPVYVFDQDASETPPWWRGLHGNYASSGAPYDPQVGGAAAEADATAGLGYFPTIPGFNEALKGLSTQTTMVAVLEPEQGYTRPGYEETDLYGDRLVFLIRVLDVVDLPCPRALPSLVADGACSPGEILGL